MDDLIARLDALALRAYQMGVFSLSFSAPFEEAAAALRASQAEIARLKEALDKIAQGDVKRTVAVPWRETPSKHDKCPHSLMMYEDCGECIADFARAALKGDA